MFKIKNKKDYFLSNRRGLSLMEVLILISIIGVMSAISIGAMVTAKTNSELESAAEEVVAVLREAQNYSLTGKDVSAVCSVYGFNVPVVNGSNYSIGNTCFTYNYQLKNGIVFSNSGTVNFTAPHAATSGTTLRYLLRKGATTSYYTVCVNTAGLITKLNGNVACP